VPWLVHERRQQWSHDSAAGPRLWISTRRTSGGERRASSGPESANAPGHAPLRPAHCAERSPDGETGTALAHRMLTTSATRRCTRRHDVAPCTGPDLQERHPATQKGKGPFRLIIPRSWVRAPPAPHSVTCGNSLWALDRGGPWCHLGCLWCQQPLLHAVVDRTGRACTVAWRVPAPARR
jgi:hypothetical protein